MAEIRMPKMGDGMEEGTINVWLKHEGETVTAGEPLAEVETDKANVEIPAYETGVLSKIVVQVGQTVPVGEVIAYIGAVGAATPAGGTSAPTEPSHNADAEEGTATPLLPQEPSTGTNGTGGSNGANGSSANGNGAHGAELSIEPGLEGERIKASPLARRMAGEMQIDLARVRGTGPGGRIVERDIRAHQETAPPASILPTLVAVPTAPAEKAKPQVVTRVEPAPVSAALTGTDIKPTNMRKAIAKVTVQSKQNIPHFYVTMIVEMDRAQALLKQLNADGESKVTVNDLIVKACAVSLARVPEVNAMWTPEGTIRRYAEAHIGVAVGIEDGLIIPVVRDCQTKTLRQISVDAKALIGKARAGQLQPSEYSGGTFSVSNLGMMGVDEFIAIINPPEAAILAIGGIVREPVVVEGDQLEIRARMKITISADHRLLDGVTAARFVQEVKKLLEAPFTLLS